MNISDFAKKRGLAPQVISKYIYRHPEIQEHIRKEGRTVELLPEAVAMLEKVYPEPVEVIRDLSLAKENELLRKLEESQNKVIALQERIESLSIIQYQIETKETEIKRLEAENKQIDDRLIEIQAEKEKLKESLEDQTEQTKEALAEVERLKGRNLWERIRNK